MFNQLTEYRGQQDTFHLFKMKKLQEENLNSPNFYLIFDEEKQLHRARLEQNLIGQYDFKVLVPLTERTFTKEDWYIDDCSQIQETVLQEGSMFVSFMW